MTTISDISNKPITITKDSTVNDAIKQLRDKKISRLLVDGENKILTEKDIGLFLLTDETERTLEKIPISEISKPLISLGPKTSIKEAAQTLIENSIGSLGVSANGAIDGIITKTDLAKFYSENHEGKK